MYSIALLCPCELESERLSDQLVILVFVKGKKKKNRANADGDIQRRVKGSSSPQH